MKIRAHWLALIFGILFAFWSIWQYKPEWVLGPFLEPIAIEGWLADDGEIYIQDTRLVRRDATPGKYLVKVHRLLPEPESLICDGSGRSAYKASEVPQTITLDFGYYAGFPQGAGRTFCPAAYEADLIALDVIWCERQVNDVCVGRVNLDQPIVIDLRAGRQ